MPFLVAMDVLADDDGVVDHDAEHQDEGEARDHVDAQVQARHQGEGAEKADRDPEADPEGEAHVEKQRQHDEDEHEPGGAVGEHDRQPVGQHLRLVLPDRQGDALGQPRIRAPDVVAHGGRDVERALLARAVYRYRHGRKLVEAGALIGLREPVDDGRHVAQQQAAAVGPGPEHEPLVVGAAVGLADRAQQDLAARGAHRTAGQVQRGAPHGVRHLVERQLVPAQRHLRHLDGDLVRRDADDLHLADLRQGDEPVAHQLGDRLQGRDVGGARDGDVRHLAAGDQLPDDRPLGFHGERRDRLDVVRHLVEHAPGIGAGLELHDHRRAALGRGRRDLLDAVDVLDGLLDADDDPGLDLLRRRAEVGHLDSDAAQIELGEYLFGDRRGARQAAGDDQNHQEVRGDGVAGEPADRAVHGDLPRPDRVSCKDDAVQIRSRLDNSGSHVDLSHCPVAGSH